MRRAKVAVPPSLAIAKAKRIAESMEIPENEFKASWQRLKRFRSRRGLEQMLLHGEEAEVDKEDPALLEQLDPALYKSFLQLKEQVFLANFVDIDATAEFDGLVNDFDKLESRMRKLIRLQREKQSCSLKQLTLHDYFH
jgi:hypothetical protein